MVLGAEDVLSASRGELSPIATDGAVEGGADLGIGSALGTRRWGDIGGTFEFPGPDGDPVAPPELSGDAPVAEVVEPVEAGVGVTFGEEGDFAGTDGVGGAAGEVGGVQEPLVGEIGLDGGFGTVGVSDFVAVGDGFFEQSERFEVPDDGFSGGETVQGGVFSADFVDGGVGVEDVDEGEVVTEADGIVVWVVCGGDLEEAG